MKYKFKLLVSLLILALVFAGCSKKVEVAQSEPALEKVNVVSSENNPIVTIELADDKKIVIDLYPEKAPNTVNNFISLINSGFYDGLTFHRVIEKFMIQGGDPDATGGGGPGYSIAGEFLENGFDNDLSHVRGVISMARTNDPNSAGSQFFIMQQSSKQLNGKYAAFGMVRKGIEFVDEIAASKVDRHDKPIEDIVMKKVTVDLNGYKADEVTKYNK
ncbi:peptidylprolyl isomerase [Helicovermis profundi]|uniref:Peptidyl-prolyl cis-trans isomerase n=1 Tax=Helicovermis profundi TaxID=3065157 RepID=A0AAU9E596_9FIRM|nr:peptidylprolyl isomerase [Clostridia bacterium S502]